VQLRLAIENNIRDFDASEQIVYLADANVVHLFLNPYKNWKSVTPFKEILGQDKRDLGVATAVISAEYIFSRLLAQQKGYPVFIAAEHVDEIVDHFRRIDKPRPHSDSYVLGQRSVQGPPEWNSPRDETSKDSASPRVSRDWRRIADALELLRQKLGSASYDATKMRELFAHTVPQTINALNEGEMLAQQQFARLQRDDLIRPLRLAPHLDRRYLDSIEDRQFEEWRAVLAAFVHEDFAEAPEGAFSAGHSYGRRQPRDRIMRRDANVLTQLFSINDRLLARKAPVKFVLITGDEKIHYAVAYRKMHELYNGENFLRRPIQFLPVLNFEEMPNIIFKSDSITEMRSVIDSILGLKRGIAPEFLHDLIYQLAVELKRELEPRPDPSLPAWKLALQEAWHNTIQTSFDVNIAPRIDNGIAKVRKAWDRLLQNALSLNVELLARRFQKELGPLAETLRELKESNRVGDLAQAFEEYQVRQLDVLERQHVEWCLEWLIADPVRRGAGYIPRGPLLVQQDRLGTTVSIVKAIEDVMQCTAVESGNLAGALKRILRRHDFPDLVIIAAIVAYQKGAWTQARDFAERALYRLRRMRVDRGEDNSSSLAHGSVRELEYLVALCQRFELCEVVASQQQSERDREALRFKFGSAERAHRQALANSAERFDFFTAARANAELGVLYLAGIAIDCIHPDLGLLQRHDRTRVSTWATEHLRRASSDLDTYFPDEIGAAKSETEGRISSLTRHLYFMANVNLVSAVAFFGLEDLYSHKVPRALIEAALEFVRPRLKEFPPHLEVDYEVCDWMQLEEGVTKTRRAKEIVEKCEQVLQEHEDSLTRLDRDALQRYRIQLTVRESRRD